MATYAIGDVQGCYRTLRQLLLTAGVAADYDTVWLVGDLVNRGPRSLEVLRWAADQGDGLVAVLGNHDLHLLARHAGLRDPRPGDTLEEVLAAPDCGELIDWLRARPLAHFGAEHLLIHAGLLPAWSVSDLKRLAGAAQAALGGGDWRRFVAMVCAKAPVPEADREVVAAAAALTRLRFVTAAGAPAYSIKGSPNAAPDDVVPWFDAMRRQNVGAASAWPTVVFGHWAALGLLRRSDVIALDTGCVWGRQLTAVRLDDGEVFSEPMCD